MNAAASVVLRAAHALHVLKRFGRRPLDQHARGAVGAAPDDRAIARHVAAGDAEGNRGPRRGLADERAAAFALRATAIA